MSDLELELELELAIALGANEDDDRVDAGRAIVRARLDDAMSRPVAARRPRRRRRAWFVPAIAAIVVLGGGAAIAQTTGLADRLLGTTDQEPAGRIDALEDASAPGMTDAELEEVFDQGSMRDSVGDRLKGDDGVIGATIVDDRGGLRLSLVRTERNGVCSILSERRGGAWEPNSTACIGFPPGWPVNEGRSQGPGRTVWYGVFADGVTSVRFQLPGGTFVEPVVANGTYIYWPRKPVDPIAIDAVLDDGTVIRRDLTVEEHNFSEWSARMGMVVRCVGDDAGSDEEFQRRRIACRARHLPHPEQFEPAKPYVLTGE
jgi:hypothetical protein